MIRQSSGNRNSLLLTAGKLAWHILCPLSYAKIIEKFHRSFAGDFSRLVIYFHRKSNILSSSKERNEVGLLEDKPEFLTAKSSDIHFYLVVFKYDSPINADSSCVGWTNEP